MERTTKWVLHVLKAWGGGVEQLGCIHDFLFHQIKPAYDDIASHDIEWGSMAIQPALKHRCFIVQAFMSTGLASIHEVVTAETYAERHKLLYERAAPDIQLFLYDSLERYSACTCFISDWEQSRFPGDCGPRNAMQWAAMQSNKMRLGN